MKKLQAWLNQEPFGKKLVLYIIICVFAKLLVVSLIIEFGKLLGINLCSETEPKTISILTFYFPFIVFGLALGEEMFFRFPLAILIDRKLPLPLVLLAALALSVIFGAGHGGLKHIFVQGVGGLFYSILFLKSGAFTGHQMKALGVSTTAHFTSNMILAGAYLLQGRTMFV